MTLVWVCRWNIICGRAHLLHFGHTIFGPNPSLGLFCFSSYRQDPVDGQIQHLADAQQVHEAPEDGRDERGDHDEQEPVGSAEQGRGRAGHADDAKQLSRREEETPFGH